MNRKEIDDNPGPVIGWTPPRTVPHPNGVSKDSGEFLVEKAIRRGQYHRASQLAEKLDVEVSVPQGSGRRYKGPTDRQQSKWLAKIEDAARNVCPVCYMAKSASGACGCER